MKQYTSVWNEIVQSMAELDCLLCLTKVSDSGMTMSRPTFISNEPSQLDITQMYHPCMANKMTESFIKNDIKFGDTEARTMVLTGPNMGGKSTMLRQVCICVIMAQIGCYVPAYSYKGTIIDRVFTRLGARYRYISF